MWKLIDHGGHHDILYLLKKNSASASAKSWHKKSTIYGLTSANYLFKLRATLTIIETKAKAFERHCNEETEPLRNVLRPNKANESTSSRFQDQCCRKWND